MTPSEGKDCDSTDSEKIYYSNVLTCSVDSFGFFSSFSSPAPPPTVVIVDFSGTMKSN